MATTEYVDPRSASHELREFVFDEERPRPSDKYSRLQNVAQNIPILGALIPRSKPEPFARLDPHEIASHPDPEVRARFESLTPAQRAQMVMTRPSEYLKYDRGQRRAMLGLAPVETAGAKYQQERDLGATSPETVAELSAAQASGVREAAADEFGIPYYDSRGNMIQKNENTGRIHVLSQAGKAGERWGEPYENQMGDLVQKNETTGKITILRKASAASQDWSNPFRNDAGDLVQRNSATNEMRVVSRKSSEGAEYTEPFEDEQGNLIQINKKSNKQEIVRKAQAVRDKWSDPAKDESGAWVQRNERTNEIRTLHGPLPEWGPATTNDDGSVTQKNLKTGKIASIKKGDIPKETFSRPYLDSYGNLVQYNIATNEHRILANAKTLSPGEKAASFPDISSARGQFNQLSKQFVDVRDSYMRVLAATQDPSAAGDLALIFNFMKMLDPESVVRESEFANAAATGSMGQRWIGVGKKLLSGERLSDVVRQDFITQAGNLFGGQVKFQTELESEYDKIAESMGVPPEQITIDHIGDFRAGLAETQDRVATQEDANRVAAELGTEDPVLIRAELEKQGYRIP